MTDGPYRPYAVFQRVGPHYWRFLGTYGALSELAALQFAVKVDPWLKEDPDLVAFDWQAGLAWDEDGARYIDRDYVNDSRPWLRRALRHEREEYGE